MKLSPSSPLPHSTSSLILTLAVTLIVMTGCGSGGSSSGSGQHLSGNTNVTLMLSSTANDELQAFFVGLSSITLTSQSGKTVTLFSAPPGTEEWAEFIHVNGGAEPFVTVSAPQDIYTAATVAIDQSGFTCVTLTPAGGLDTSSFAYGTNANNAPPTTVTVNMSSPITITGESMGLMLDLQVAQSATYSSCYSTGLQQWSISPVFNLTPVTFSGQPTNAKNGKVSQVDGQITAVGSNGGSFTLTLPESSRTLSITAGSTTTYQGVAGFSALGVGTFVDLDGAIQPDGSLTATRIAVDDPSAVDVQIGPALIVGGDPVNAGTSDWAFNRLSQGQDTIPNNWPYNVTAAVFQVSGQFDNLETLPFAASVGVANIVAGQNFYVSTQKFLSPNDPYTPASTVTLRPQTINATVAASSQIGSFTDYTVTLAPYDLFPTLAVQQGQTTLLTNPSQVEIYVDSNTQLLNIQALAPGSTLRFYGLVFNDNGTLRMDCAQVNDGVTQMSQSTAARLPAGLVQKSVHTEPDGMQRTITALTRQ